MAAAVNEMQKLKTREAEKSRKTAKQAAVTAVEEKQTLESVKVTNRRMVANGAHKRRNLLRGQVF